MKRQRITISLLNIEVLTWPNLFAVLTPFKASANPCLNLLQYVCILA